MFKRTLALTLSALMLLSVLVACGGGKGEVTTPAVTTEGAVTTLAPVETDPPETTKKLADVPEADYEGADFDIYVSGNVTYKDFTYQDTTAVLENAIYLRNENIQDKYNIVIKVTEGFSFGNCYGAGPGYVMTRRGHTASENDFDLSFLGTHDASTCAIQGYLENLHDVPYIDLSNQWWDQKATEQMEMNGIMFYTTGNISTIVDQFTFAIMFNKNIAEEHKLDLYTLVRDGKWTVDAWSEATKLISEDVNGDDKMDHNDKYGSLVWNDALLGVINATGGAIGTLNEEGTLELTLYNEINDRMIAKYLETAYSDNCFNIQTISSDRTNIRRQMFLEDRALFWLYNVGDDNNAFRNSETLEYGYLPYFKLDEEQKEYACHIQEGACYFMCVPVMTVDMEKTGTITEAMACESYYTVKPAYFDKQLIGTYIHDEESVEMLEIIFGSRLFDVGAFYQIGGYTTNLMSFFLNRRTDFASFCEQSRKVAESAIGRINDSIKKNVLG